MKIKKKKRKYIIPIICVMGLVSLLTITILIKVEIIDLNFLEGTFLDGFISAISFNPEDERLIGYEFLDEGSVVHIWNTQDDYFFEKDAGIQLTNHYEDYWTKNIFCIGYYNGDEWIKIKCADELTNFEKSIESDDETYVNATLWKNVILNIEGNDYDFRLAVNYYLGLDDEKLSVTIYGKNIGIDIPYDLGFAWKVTDWDIPSNEAEDILIINNSGYAIKGNYDLLFKNLDETFFKGRDTTYDFGGEFLRVDWNKNLDYTVKMYGNGIQEDFYVALLINAGHFNPNQEKSTTFQWIDAVTMGISAGFVTEAPTNDPSGSETILLDSFATATGFTSPVGAGKIVEIGWWCDNPTEESNFEVGIYDSLAGPRPNNLLDGASKTNAKGTTAGWKRVTGLNIAITSETIYWITVQLDDTSTTTLTDREGSGGEVAWRFDQSTLPDPIFELPDDGIGWLLAFYAVWEAGGDETPPTYSNNQTNTTIAGALANFSIDYDDDTALHPNGQWIFSTNNTGEWVNESLVKWTTTPQSASVVKTLNTTVGLTIAYRWYANDTAGNVNNTEIFYLTTTSADTCTPDSPLTGDYIFECSDTCTISSSIDADGYDILVNGSGSLILNEDIYNLGDVLIRGQSSTSRCDVYCLDGCFI